MTTSSTSSAPCTSPPRASCRPAIPAAAAQARGRQRREGALPGRGVRHALRVLIVLASGLLLAARADAVTPADSVRSGELEQGWYRLTQALDPFDEQTLRARSSELSNQAERISLRRLTPFAMALVARSRSFPADQADAALECAAQLDPGCPEAHIALARLRLSRWEVAAGVASLARGAYSLAADGRYARLLAGSAAISLLAGLLAAFALWALIVARRVMPAFWHDLMEMGAHWRLGSNAVVVAAVALALPLFAGGDVGWLALWVFALAWGYLPPAGRIAGIGGLLLVAVAPTVLELGFRTMARNPDGILQATTALAENRYQPQVLDELDALSDLLGESPEYYRLQGDVYRQFGLLDGAAWAYREGLRRAPDHGPLSLSLGTVRYLEGDYNAALQAFQTARTAGADPVVVNYNLALTFAQTYHFRESDEAMARAREIDDPRLRRISKGRDHQPILLAFTAAEAGPMLAAADTVSLVHRGLVLPPMLQERSVAHAFTLAALTALIFAIGHYLLRDRTTGFATACLKCGRAFCRRCRLSQERQSYCAQCVNIFLKKDAVGIEAQMAKRRQVARHLVAQRIERRLGDTLLPGLGLAVSGRPLLGAGLASVALVCATAVLVWLPLFVEPALMYTAVWPLQAVFGALWLLALVLAQAIPAERR